MIPSWSCHCLKKVILIGPDEEAFSRVEPELKEKVEFLSRERLLEMEEAEVSAFVKESGGRISVVYFHRQRCALRDGRRHKLEPG